MWALAGKQQGQQVRWYAGQHKPSNAELEHAPLLLRASLAALLVTQQG